jgi:predicted XRE-type DNA-binding protein
MYFVAIKMGRRQGGSEPDWVASFTAPVSILALAIDSWIDSSSARDARRRFVHRPPRTEPNAFITGRAFSIASCKSRNESILPSRLTLQIYRIIRERKMTQTEAAKVLGNMQPHVSLLASNRSGSFSVGRLIEFLTALGQDYKLPSDQRARNTALSVTVPWDNGPKSLRHELGVAVVSKGKHHIRAG